MSNERLFYTTEVDVNLSIAKRVGNIIDENLGGRAYPLRAPISYWVKHLPHLSEADIRIKAKTGGVKVTLDNTSQPPIQLLFRAYKTYTDLGLDTIEGYVRRFALPAYTIEASSDTPSLIFTTPYGRVPRYAIDLSGGVCMFGNVFIFDSLGKARVAEYTLAFVEEVEGFEEDMGVKLDKIDEIVKDNTRLRKLKKEDYSLVQNMLTLVEAGQFQ